MSPPPDAASTDQRADVTPQDPATSGPAPLHHDDPCPLGTIDVTVRPGRARCATRTRREYNTTAMR